jgi:hypothetical protein
MVNIRREIFSFKCICFCLLDDQTNETNPDVILVILQSAASDLERATEV